MATKTKAVVSPVLLGSYSVYGNSSELANQTGYIPGLAEWIDRGRLCVLRRLVGITGGATAFWRFCTVALFSLSTLKSRSPPYFSSRYIPNLLVFVFNSRSRGTMSESQGETLPKEVIILICIISAACVVGLHWCCWMNQSDECRS